MGLTVVGVGRQHDAARYFIQFRRVEHLGLVSISVHKICQTLVAVPLLSALCLHIACI